MDNDDDKPTVDAKLKEKFQNAALAYSDISELRALVNFIPLIGSSIDVIISSEAQKIQYNRIRQTIKCLTDEMVKIDKDKIDKSFLDTEEFFDLLILFFEKCTKTRHIEKVKLNCKILSRSIIIDNATERPFAYDILNNIADLTPRDLDLSIRIFDQQKGELPQYTEEYRELTFVKERGWDNLQPSSKLTEFDFSLSLFNLAKSGLIKEIQGSYIGYYGGSYIITDAFRKLMSFIEFSNTPIFSNYLK
jgi:hypothetical protein